MQALRIHLDGVTTSFRFPHLLVGRQPTYPLPPPATIYGHLCSAIGEYVDPSGLRFGYTFIAEAQADDLEHQHIVNMAGSRMRGYPELPGNIEGTIQPGLRQVLYRPSLTLYIDAPGKLPDIAEAFRKPRYAVCLGRSQDLAGYHSVELVELFEGTGYFEGTLLPLDYLATSAASTAQHFLMPRFIDPEDRRRVQWQPYLALLERAEPLADVESGWFDSRTPEWRGHRRAVVWHEFVVDQP